MTYVTPNFPTKKALVEAVARGDQVSAYEPGIGRLPAGGGTVDLEGPHFPKPHKWYTRATVDEHGTVTSVK